VRRDQIPLHRPLFGVEPSGHHLISNGRANYEKWQIMANFTKFIDAPQRVIVKNSDRLRAGIGPKKVIFG